MDFYTQCWRQLNSFRGRPEGFYRWLKLKYGTLDDRNAAESATFQLLFMASSLPNGYRRVMNRVHKRGGHFGRNSTRPSGDEDGDGEKGDVMMIDEESDGIEIEVDDAIMIVDDEEEEEEPALPAATKRKLPLNEDDLPPSKRRLVTPATVVINLISDDEDENAAETEAVGQIVQSSQQALKKEVGDDLSPEQKETLQSAIQMGLGEIGNQVLVQQEEEERNDDKSSSSLDSYDPLADKDAQKRAFYAFALRVGSKKRSWRRAGLIPNVQSQLPLPAPTSVWEKLFAPAVAKCIMSVPVAVNLHMIYAWITGAPIHFFDCIINDWTVITIGIRHCIISIKGTELDTWFRSFVPVALEAMGASSASVAVKQLHAFLTQLSYKNALFRADSAVTLIALTKLMELMTNHPEKVSRQIESYIQRLSFLFLNVLDSIWTLHQKFVYPFDERKLAGTLANTKVPLTDPVVRRAITLALQPVTQSVFKQVRTKVELGTPYYLGVLSFVHAYAVHSMHQADEVMSGVPESKEFNDSKKSIAQKQTYYEKMRESQKNLRKGLQAIFDFCTEEDQAEYFMDNVEMRLVTQELSEAYNPLHANVDGADLVPGAEPRPKRDPFEIRVPSAEPAPAARPFVEDERLRKWKIGATHPRSGNLEFIRLTDCLGPWTMPQAALSVKRYGHDSAFIARIIFNQLGPVNDEIRQLFTKRPVDVTGNVLVKIADGFVAAFVSHQYILDCISPYRTDAGVPVNTHDNIIQQQREFAKTVYRDYLEILTYKPPKKADSDSSSSE